MIKKTLLYFWSLRREFAKYFIVGFSGVFLDMGFLILFVEKFHMLPVVAVVVNQVILLNYNFILNKYWSFRNKAMPHKQVVKYLSLAAVNYAFSVGMMYWFNHLVNFDYKIVRMSTIVIMVSWNFFLYKYWVYRAEAVVEPKIANVGVNNFNS